MKKYFRGLSLYVLIFLIIILASMLGTGLMPPKPDAQMTYSTMIQKIQNNEVKRIDIYPDAEAYNTGKASATLGDGTVVMIQLPSLDRFMDTIQDQMEEKQIVVNTHPIPRPNWLMQLIPSLIIMVLVVFLLIFIMQQVQGGSGGNRVMSFGKSRAKMVVDDKRKVTFDNVAGLDEEKEELKEIVEFLKQPKKFAELGARIPKGVLLIGPPGTGKTLLAKAISGEAGVPFFSISGSDFVEMFVGVGASRVRDLFEQAKKNAPCIIFIDEIDAVGRRRGAGLGGGHDEREQTLNQLLVEMDGFGANEGVIVVAATNRADILDPALLRPGRFDRRVVVGRPDVRGREEILQVHAKGKPLSDDVDLSVIARTTAGFTGADLENLLNEAALLTARENKKAVDMVEIQKALIKVGMGTEKKSRSRIISDKEKKNTAYHEVGHAILQAVLSEMDPVHSISIIPTGMALGYMMSLPSEDKWSMTRTYMQQRIVVALGGRAAEDLIFNEVTTGAASDIEQTTSMARSMVTKYGMSDKLGPIQFGDDNDEIFIGRDLAHTRNYGESIASTIDSEVKRIVDEAYSEAKQILQQHMEAVHRIVDELVKKEKLTGEEFYAVFPEGKK